MKYSSLATTPSLSEFDIAIISETIHQIPKMILHRRGAQSFLSRGLRPSDEVQLAQFFRLIANDREARLFFYPHPLTDSFACHVTRQDSIKRDFYSVWLHRGAIAGYFMLRGWDSGFEIPSFGCCIAPQFRNLGLGRASLVVAIQHSFAKGASRLRLTVQKTTTRALHLYRSFGFTFCEKGPKELIGDLHLANVSEIPVALDDVIPGSQQSR